MRPRTYKYIDGLSCHQCNANLPPIPENRVRSGRGKYCSAACRKSGVAESRILPLEPRFWANVHKTDGCWLWTASTRNGYGAICVNRKQKDAHRVSWEMHKGAIPPSMFVCHKCDEPRCVNPDHLFLGTIQDNHADMVSKGRGIKGVKCHLAKLTDAKAKKILCMAKSMPQVSIAKLMEVSQTTVSNVIGRRSWKHVSV